MSSTNRGSDRRKSDYYVTPVKPIIKFLNELITADFYFAEKINKSFVFDPCAGGDDEHSMSYPKAIKNVSTNYPITNDIRKDSKAYMNQDYLNVNFSDIHGLENPSIIISNPPFKDAMEFIKKSLKDIKNNGYVIYLLRLNFFGTQKRFNFWQEYMPKYTFIHHKRMSFTDDGGTDSIEYAHFVWHKGYYPEFTKTKVI